MTKKNPKPELLDMAMRIRKAMDAKNLTNGALARALGLRDKHGTTISNWTRGHGAPSRHLYAPLAQLLDLTEAELMPSVKIPKGWKPRLTVNGPAAQALALSQARDTLLPPPKPVIQDVFSFAARADGQVTIKLNTVLPYGKAVSLIQSLLAFGLILGGESDPHGDTAPC